MAFEEGSMDPSVILIAASIVGVTTISVAFLGCLWCRNKWKKLSRRHYEFPEHPPATQQVENGLTEFTLFPPPTTINQFGLPTGISPDEVVFEPLPEIRSRVVATTQENVRPARFTGSCEKISLQDWFDEYQVNFPRGQLHFLREVGPTWYGQAVEGEAVGVKGKVVVKILRVDATSTELTQYLQETRVCRDLKHPNLLNLLNRCLEVHPFLLIMEHCDTDLKSYLIEQRKSPETLLRDGILLRMACDIATALQYMHEHGFIHMDVAAHSCLVTSEGVVKVGDYGTAVHLHKSDFYCLGDVAFPIRWCAPETLMCTESVVEAKDITREANIWSFGIVLWELLEFGKLPYLSLNDNDVIQKVLIEKSLRLEQPKTPCIHNNMIYKIMHLCWQPPSIRPTIQKISSLLSYLYDNRDVQSETFESRWNSLQPHNMHQAPAHVTSRFENDFASDDFSGKSVRTLDGNSFTSNDFSGNENFGQNSFASEEFGQGDKSPSSGSISIGDLAADMSPSLLNLRGSVEDLISRSADSQQISGDTTSRARTQSENGTLDSRSEDSENITLDRQTEPGIANGRCKDSEKLAPATFNRQCEESESGTRNRGFEDLKPETRKDSVESETGVLNRQHEELTSRTHKDSIESESGTLNRGYEDSEHRTIDGSGKLEHDTSIRVDKDSGKSEPSTSYEDSVKLEHEKGLRATHMKGSEYSETWDSESEPASLENAPDSIQFRITEAIRDLDTILADETSSETSDFTNPELSEDPKLNGESVSVNLEDDSELIQKNELCKSGPGGHVHANMADD